MTNALITPTIAKENIKTSAKLQNIILPDLDICTVEKLFLRLNKQCSLNYQQSSVELKKGGLISFDTYFNSLSVQKWKEHTTVETIGVNLCLKGKFKIKLLNADRFSESISLINQRLVNSEKIDEINVFDNVNLQQYKGLLYLEIEALEDDCLFKNGYFYTSLSSVQETDKKLAIVICTYKREDYVHKNIRLLEQHLINETDSDKFEIFVIDNGKTLSDFYNSRIHLIPNKNAGGSGGYTRGIIEVLQRKSIFSHIVLMDDDVVVSAEVFKRIYNFQKLANDKSLCIGGSMLRLDTRYIQHENGAIWDKKTIRLKPDLDLRTVKNVLLNEIEEYINYNGWWLFCLPTHLINETNLPYPFFIKMDDMELALRLKYKITTLNGVCVWHEPLENKYSPMMNYYLKKNEIIMNVLSADDFSNLDVIKRIVRFSLREAFCYRYKSANLVLKAIADFLQGPDYLRAIDPEEKNLEILTMGEKAIKEPELPFIYKKYEKSVSETENSINRFVRFITLNGHLLPNFFFHKNTSFTDQGYRIAPIQNYRPLNVFRARKALYYHVTNQEGFVVELSRIEFFQILIRAIMLSLEVFFKFSRLKQLYRETLPELTNVDFWKSYLDVNQKVLD